ncbi:MAG: isochorismatase family cysteine hydrolase [Vulcanimicrobiota bacterium]
MELGEWGLVVVDLQRYYVDTQASFVRYFEAIHPGASHYISQRVHQLVVPRLRRVVERTRQLGRPIIYLRLCGQREDRTDLHRHFLKCYREAEEMGFPDLYPLSSQSLAEVMAEVRPEPGDHVLDKTTYSGFTSSSIEQLLAQLKLTRLVMTGLATSQCVETTARDASDRGFGIVHLEDCQADYHEVSHRASLFASRSVCGGHVWDSREFLELI